MIMSVSVVDMMWVWRAANFGVFLRYSIKESERLLKQNLIVSESVPDEWRSIGSKG